MRRAHPYPGGNCGGMAQKVVGGDLVVASAAIRQEGTSREYLPVEFPAAADFAVTRALADSAARLGYPAHTGVVHCKDSFYGQHSPEASPVAPWLKMQWQAWLKGGCLASEMESAALFILAGLPGRAGRLRFDSHMESGTGGRGPVQSPLRGQRPRGGNRPGGAARPDGRGKR